VLLLCLSLTGESKGEILLRPQKMRSTGRKMSGCDQKRRAGSRGVQGQCTTAQNARPIRINTSSFVLQGIHLYMHTHISTHTHMYIHTHTHVLLHIQAYTHMHPQKDILPHLRATQQQAPLTAALLGQASEHAPCLGWAAWTQARL
jgi:hypothetical protein